MGREADHGRGRDRQGVGRPTEARAAGLERPVTDRDPDEVRGEDRAEEPGDETARRRDGVGQERAEQEDDREREHGHPRVTHEDRADGSGQDRDGDGRERWVHGAAGSSSG